MGAEKVVLDTNVLVSALGWPGKPRKVLESVLDKEFELVISHQQFVELQRVINYGKLNFAWEEKERFLSVLLNVATLVKIKGKLRVLEEDPSDDMILETALEGKAKYIVSGDRHLTQIGTFQGIRILTPNEFAELKGI